MPIVKKPNGYYWGNRGPFATKSKALAVARAAYANGYREDNAIHTIQQQVRYVGLQKPKEQAK